jgi:hypothetical protein
MDENKKAIGLKALQDWAEPKIAAAGWMERGAIKSYLDEHGPEIVEAIGNAILSE